jgi:hypothetical protein
MRLRLLSAWSLLLLLAGCAGMTPSSLSPDHPANPAAAESPLSPPSQTLTVNDAPPSGTELKPSQLKTEMGSMHHGDHLAGKKHEAPSTPPGENAALSAPLRTPATTQASVYTCKMHPEVSSNAPGKCAKCGMKLVVKGAP